MTLATYGAEVRPKRRMEVRDVLLSLDEVGLEAGGAALVLEGGLAALKGEEVDWAVAVVMRRVKRSCVRKAMVVVMWMSSPANNS